MEKRVIIANKNFAYLDVKGDDPNAIYVDEEILKEIGKSKCFDIVNRCVINCDSTKNQRIQIIKEGIRNRKNMLTNSDYHLFKYIEGEMTGSEFEPIKSQRALWRKEINQLEEELKRYETI